MTYQKKKKNYDRQKYFLYSDILRSSTSRYITTTLYWAEKKKKQTQVIDFFESEIFFLFLFLKAKLIWK